MTGEVEHRVNVGEGEKIHNILNTYIVRATVHFIDGFNIELDFNEVVKNKSNNEETLTDEAILDLCNCEKY